MSDLVANTIRVGLAPRDGTARWVVIGPDFVDVSQLKLDDIAGSLGLLPRFGGHTVLGGRRVKNSVARHSVILTNWLERLDFCPRVLKEAMLHDAPEALGVNDIQHFVKREYGVEIKKLEHRIMEAVYDTFIGPVPPWGLDPVLDYYDKRLGAIEATYFGWRPEGHEYLPGDPDLSVEFAGKFDLDDGAEWVARWETIE